jgi:hypothetical protein
MKWTSKQTMDAKSLQKYFLIIYYTFLGFKALSLSLSLSLYIYIYIYLYYAQLIGDILTLLLAKFLVSFVTLLRAICTTCRKLTHIRLVMSVCPSALMHDSTQEPLGRIWKHCSMDVMPLGVYNKIVLTPSQYFRKCKRYFTFSKLNNSCCFVFVYNLTTFLNNSNCTASKEWNDELERMWKEKLVA